MNGASLGIFDPGQLVSLRALTAQSGVAAGTGDNTELTSAALDRKPVGLAGYDAGVLGVGYLTTVAAAQTLKLTVKISESDDGTTFGADTTLVNALTIETGAVTGKNNVYELGIDLRGYKRYVRFKVTLDLSAGAADTFVYAAQLALVSADKYPI